MSFNGKSVLITGASTGIGAAAAIAFARQGANVAINYLNSTEAANQVAAQVRDNGSRALTIQADVTDRETVDAMVERVEEEFGAVDVLVNNAGNIYERVPLREMSDIQWHDVIDLNLHSVFYCARAVMKGMIARETGTIVNVTSISGRNGGGTGAGAYGTAKAGAIGLTKALAKELAPWDITVNSVAPGQIDTPFHEKAQTKNIEAIVSNIPLGRSGEPEDVADVIVFLASDAARYITGVTIDVNGGLLMP